MADTQAYLDRLRSHLRLDPEVEDDVVRELRTHIEDRVSDLEATGLRRDEASRAVLERLDRPRDLARRYREAYRPATWHDALTASAAFLLVAALFATHLWSAPAPVAAVAVIVVGATLYGLWAGRPTWFYAWAGLALTMLSFAGYFAFVLLQRSAGPLADGGIDAVALLGFAGATLYFPVAIVVLLSCIVVASRRDWLDASLMLSPSVPVIAWIATLHAAGGIRAAGDPAADGALAVCFLTMAVAVFVFVRATSRASRLAIIVATAAFLLFTVSSVYGDLSLAALSGRAVLTFAFLLSPAAVEAIGFQPLRSSLDGD